jgi:uncharacterized repeat protein (TIGR03843 family)
VPPQKREEPALLGPEGAARREALLRRGEVEVIGRLPYSSNQTFLVRCCDEAGETAAVYKPARGERPLYDFPDRTLFRRETAAHLVDTALGWGLVPPTIVRENLPFGEGALQLFIDHDPEEHYFTLLAHHQAAFRRLAVFDVLINNADRKSGHCLLGAGDHVWGVDHGLTFHAEPKLRTVIWDFAGDPVPASELAATAKLAARLGDADDALTIDLGELLDQGEVVALRRRARALQQAGVFPHPDSSWSFPWPLV